MELSVTGTPFNVTSKNIDDTFTTQRLYDILGIVILSLGLVVSVLATAGNILTMIVYFRLGFAESTNISLVTLAISDVVVSFTSVCSDLSYLLPYLDRFLITPEVSFSTMWVQHVVFTRFSALITTFLSLERYLCVLMPLKIKRIVNGRRTVVFMVVFFIITIPPVTCAYFRYPLGMRYVPARNTSLIGVLPIDDETIKTTYMILQVYYSNIIPFGTFITVATCTVLLAMGLRKSKSWRDSNRYVSKMPVSKSAEHNQDEQQVSKEKKTDSKELRAVRMVVAIATVFIVSMIPSCAFMVVAVTVPGFRINGENSDLYILTGHVFLVIDSLNAGANVLIYYNMSTKFRLAVRDLVCSCRRTSGTKNRS